MSVINDGNASLVFPTWWCHSCPRLVREIDPEKIRDLVFSLATLNEASLKKFSIRKFLQHDCYVCALL